MPWPVNLKCITISPCNQDRTQSGSCLLSVHLRPKGKLQASDRFPSDLKSQEDRSNIVCTACTVPQEHYRVLSQEDKPLCQVLSALKQLIVHNSKYQMPAIVVFHLVNRDGVVWPHYHLLIQCADFYSTPAGKILVRRCINAGFYVKVQRTLGGLDVKACKQALHYLQKKDKLLICINDQELINIWNQSKKLPIQEITDLDDEGLYEDVAPTDDISGDLVELSDADREYLMQFPEHKDYFTFKGPEDEREEQVENYFEGQADSYFDSELVATASCSGSETSYLPSAKKMKLSAYAQGMLDLVELCKKYEWSKFPEIDRQVLPGGLKTLYDKMKVTARLRTELLQSLQLEDENVPTLFDSYHTYKCNKPEQYSTVAQTAKQYIEWSKEAVGLEEGLIILLRYFEILNGNGDKKKAGLRFWGAGDTGKTAWFEHCIGAIFKKQVIVPDNAFTFAPLVRGNYMVINEMRLSDELCETLKDLMDRDKQKAVAVKNRSSVSLNHEAIWICTHNHDISESLGLQSKHALNLRFYTWNLPKPLDCIMTHKMGLSPNPTFFVKVWQSLDETYEPEDDDANIMHIGDCIKHLLSVV